MNTIERRLTTILAADVVGYSKLVEQDEAGTVATVKAVNVGFIEPKCRQYNGRIVKYMGDGVLMEFSSIVDATIFAVELQAVLADPKNRRNLDSHVIYRIGINIGEIIVDGDDLQGNGINIAARIESIADPGGVFLSDAAYAQVKGKVDLKFERRGKFKVKNISEPVSVWAISMDEKAQKHLTPIENINSKSVRKLLVLPKISVAILMIIGVGVGAWFWFDDFHSTDSVDVAQLPLVLPDEPSLAVLPFKQIGTDSNETYFSDGLTIDLNTGLSKFSGLFVSANNSASQFTDNTVSLADVAAKLGVRYILQGSVQRASQRVRVNTTLVEASTSKILWSEKYDRDIADIFAVQDEIVAKIISAMTVSVNENELRRSLSKAPASMQAYDFYLRARELNRNGNRSDNFESQGLYQQAIEQDPGFALAYTGLGWAVLGEATNGWTHDPTRGIRRAHDLALAALEVEPHAQGRALLGMTYLLMKHFDLAKENLDIAINMNPNDATSYGALGEVSLWTSQLEQAEASYLKSMRLDPKTSANILTGLGATLFLMGRPKEALPLLKKSVIRDSNILFTHLMLVATNSELGRKEEAKISIDKARKLHPFFEIAPYQLAFENPAHGELFAQSLLKVGLE